MHATLQRGGLTASFLIACLAACATASALASGIMFEIAAGAAPSTLKQFAAQAHVQLLFDYKVAQSLRTPAVHGQLEPTEALKLLLEGSGLTFRQVNDHTIAVVPIGSASTTSAASAATQPPSDDKEGKTSSSNGFRVAQATSGPAPVAAPVSAGAQPTALLQEVVVTAQKREEKLQNVPMSISVLSGAELDRSTAQGVSEVLNDVPGVATSGNYLGGGTNISIRGVASSFPFFAGSSAVAYYLDSVPFGLVKSAVGPDANAYDLQRVEVLRGPQGTLYGASALNGVVRILTHDVDLSSFDLTARASDSGTDGGANNYRGDLMINAPLIEDKLGIRAAVGYQSDSGWIDQPDKRNANDTQIATYRLKVAAQPTDQLSVGLSAWLSRSNSGAPDLGYTWDKTSSSLNQPITTDYDAYSLKLAYQFTYFSVTSLTSDFWYQNTGVLGLDIPGFGNAPGASFLNQITSRVKSEEINVVSSAEGPWRWSLGGMYRHATEDRYQVFTVFPVPTIQYYDTSESYAAFGELTRLLFDDRLEITAGLRHFHDHIPQQEQIAPGTPYVDASSTAEANTPRAAVTWHATDQWMVYSSYSQGFRSGFPQDIGVLLASPTFPPVRPDRLVNYEVGSKGSFLNNRLTVDASVYHIDWRDIQLQLNVPYQGVPNIAVVNGAAAKGNGFDLAISAQLSEGLSISPYVSWNDLGLTSNVISNGLPLFLKGDRPSGSPETTAGLSVNYSHDIRNGYRFRLGASANYTSKIAYHSISSANTVLVQSSDDITIARLNFSLDMPSHVTVTLYGDNLNNEHGSTARVFTDSIPDWDARVRPLTVGIQFEYHLR